jgi:hypothetical protein
LGRRFTGTRDCVQAIATGPVVHERMRYKIG